jgi:hypothetical protein
MGAQDGHPLLNAWGVAEGDSGRILNAWGVAEGDSGRNHSRLRATQVEITHAYRRPITPTCARQHLTATLTNGYLRQILAAYALLRDPHRRAGYDRTTEPART